MQIANWLRIFNQAASTRCSGDNKEKLSTNVCSEYASDFCYDRKSALKDKYNNNNIFQPRYPTVNA